MTKIVFMGTPEFAVPTLEKLHKDYEVASVVTVPDKPQGRGLTLHGSAVKVKAQELGIPVLQPESLKDENFIEELKKIDADIFCVVAFRILPKSVYSLPKLASFNIHGSLLPKYRGAAPINWAIIQGENTTGLTSFILQDKVDTGDILLKKEIDIIPLMTAGELHDALMPLAAELASETIDVLIKGEYTPIKQDNAEATPAPKIFREDCQLNFNMPVTQVINKVHGLSPYPGAFTNIEDNGQKSLKILKCSQLDLQGEPGSFVIINSKFVIYCQDGSIEVHEMQLQGKRAMQIKDFLNGWRGETTSKLH